MALDTSGSWVAGDDLRIIECLMLPFGTYVLDCTQNCMNQLQEMSDAAVLRVRALLDEYDAADQAESSQNLGDTEGKVLVKADVLEWEVTGNGVAGTTQEKANIRAEIARYFAFCSCLGSVLPGYPGGNGGYTGHSSLIRS
jgi:hypothetical protein